MFQSNQQRTEAIKRLAESKKRSDAEALQDGRAAGIAWARDSAEAAELERLEEARKRLGNDWEVEFTGDGNHLSAEERLFALMNPDCSDDPSAFNAFDENAFGGISRSPEHVLAFANGALECWRELERDVLESKQ